MERRGMKGKVQGRRRANPRGTGRCRIKVWNKREGSKEVESTYPDPVL